jgi:hypothetical protein
VFDGGYILFHFNIILNHNGIYLTKKGKPKATKCRAHRKLSFDVNTAKKGARILRRRIGRKLRIYMEKISLDIEEQNNTDSDIT